MKNWDWSDYCLVPSNIFICWVNIPRSGVDMWMTDWGWVSDKYDLEWMVDNDEGEGGEQENKKIDINYSTQFKPHGRKTSESLEKTFLGSS